MWCVRFVVLRVVVVLFACFLANVAVKVTCNNTMERQNIHGEKVLNQEYSASLCKGSIKFTALLLTLKKPEETDDCLVNTAHTLLIAKCTFLGFQRNSFHLPVV